VTFVDGSLKLLAFGSLSGYVGSNTPYPGTRMYMKLPEANVWNRAIWSTTFTLPGIEATVVTSTDGPVFSRSAGTPSLTQPVVSRRLYRSTTRLRPR